MTFRRAALIAGAVTATVAAGVYVVIAWRKARVTPESARIYPQPRFDFLWWR